MVIITTVGSSIFRKILEDEEDEKTFHRLYERIKSSKLNRRQASSYINKGVAEHVEKIEKKITDYKSAGEEYSAEIKSIERLIKVNPDVQQMFDVYLVCSDTVESIIAANFVKNFYKGKENVNIHFNLPGVNSLIKNPESIYFDPNCSKSIEHCVIKGLQVFESDEFEKEGMRDLFDALLKIRYINGKNEKVLFNITGGYKAIIPYMVIFAEIFDIPIFYIFEHSNELIRIPQLPVEFDYSILKQNYTALSQLNKDKPATLDNLLAHFLPEGEGKKIIGNLEEKGIVSKLADNSVVFTPVGRAIWKRFEELKKDNVVNNTASELIELKLFEYFVGKYSGESVKIEHSKKIKAKNGKKEFEVDVYIETNNEIIACEVKPGDNIPIEIDGTKNTIEKNIKEGAFRILYDNYKKGNGKKIDLRVYLYTTYEHLAPSPIEKLKKLKGKYSEIFSCMSFYLIKVPKNYKNYKAKTKWKAKDRIHKIYI